MDRIAEKLAGWFGSTPFILLHAVGFSTWVAMHHLKGFDPKWSTLTVVVEGEIIFLSLLILRAENVQSRRFEDDVRQHMHSNRKILKEVHKRSKK